MDVQFKKHTFNPNPIEIGKQALSWKDAANENSNHHRDDFSRVKAAGAQSKSTPGLVFFILAVLGVAQMVQYCVASLYVAKLPGNRYLNGIIFGCGEVFAMVFSNFLMNNLMDMTAFYVAYSCGLVSYLLLIFLAASSPMLTYFANVLLITSIGSWFNTFLLILELRVPPQNVGSVSALVRTMAVGGSVIAPTIANMQAPFPHVCLMGLATFAFLLTFFLPAPGKNLPAVQKTGNESAVLIDKQS